MKACSKCKRADLSPKDFYRDRQKSDGLSSTCRECIKEARKALYASSAVHRGSVKARSLARRRTMPEVLREQGKVWRDENPEKIAALYRERKLRSYNLAALDYQCLLMLQDGHCALCAATTYNARSANLGIDHDHSCCPGASSCGLCIRGLLCLKCNGEVERVSTGERQGAPDVLAYLSVMPFRIPVVA